MKGPRIAVCQWAGDKVYAQPLALQHVEQRLLAPVYAQCVICNMSNSPSTDFVKRNQQHIQQLVQQRQHELNLAEAAVLAESRQRQKLREKVLSMREEKCSTAQQPESEAKARSYGHSDTMPNCYSSPQKAASPPRRCLSAANNVKQAQGQGSSATLLTQASKEQENIVGKPYTQALSSRTSSVSPQRLPTERHQVPAQHHQLC